MGEGVGAVFWGEVLHGRLYEIANLSCLPT